MPIEKPDKTKLVKNYLTKDIEVRPYLKAYRKSLDKKFGNIVENADEARDAKSGS